MDNLLCRKRLPNHTILIMMFQFASEVPFWSDLKQEEKILEILKVGQPPELLDKKAADY